MNSQSEGLVQSFVCGEVLEETARFDDVAQLQLTPYTSRIERIEVEFDTQIYGLEVTYSIGQGLQHTVRHIGRAPGPRHRSGITLSADEYIVHFSGSYGLAIEWLRVVTNKGQTVDVGGHNGQRFEITIPEGYTVMGFKGGIGGYLQNISLVMKPIMGHPPLISPLYGGSHTDTRRWDDLPLISGASYVQFKEIRLISDGIHVLGLEVQYLVNGTNTHTSGLHIGTYNSAKRLEQVLVFQGYEIITRIEGMSGALIDYLKIGTDKGQEICMGGKGGSPFSVQIPEGKRVIAFGGGVNGHLHNLYVHFA